MGHSVTWTIEKDDLRGVLHCDEPEGAYCRTGCPVPWCEGGCDHPAADIGECLAVVWFENTGRLEEFFEGDPQPLRDGAVTVRWAASDETWLWAYAPVSVSGERKPACENCG